MRQDLTEIVAILDRSGSMAGRTEDVIGAYNNLIKEQKEVEGQANVTLVQFDSEYQLLYDRLPISEVRPLTKQVYFPRGSTALLDAIGRTINSIGAALARTPEDERPGKVIFVINTDGYENSSREFTAERIREMITHQREVYKWEFLFLGADQDAWATGSNYGLAIGQTLGYDNNKQGITSAYAQVSSTLRTFRESGATPTFEDTDIRESK